MTNREEGNGKMKGGLEEQMKLKGCERHLVRFGPNGLGLELGLRLGLGLTVELGLGQ